MSKRIGWAEQAYYLNTYVILLSHAKAYHLYNEVYRKTQKGKVGIAIDGSWYEPGSSSEADNDAVERTREFMVRSSLNF
ncbi:hypothetical protein JTB14_028394 [Gonioctena quinquepunctata]|nr:hypothetical protein JTB14_028394 [Gonioctena quinquepunctata]